MPEPKGVKEIDTKRIREQLGLDSMSMTIEQQVLAIIEENEAGAGKSINVVAQPKEHDHLAQCFSVLKTSAKIQDVTGKVRVVENQGRPYVRTAAAAPSVNQQAHGMWQ